MQDNYTDEDDWKAEAPLLADLSPEVPVDVPEGYFEELPASVLARIKASASAAETIAASDDTEMPSDAKVIRVNWVRFVTVAASVVLLVAIGTYFLINRGAGASSMLTADAEIQKQAASELAAVEMASISEALAMADIADEELFAALDEDGARSIEARTQSWEDDEAIENLQSLDFDDFDLNDLDIDLTDLY